MSHFDNKEITSADTAGLMRRINAVENVLTFGSITTVKHGNTHPSGRIACDKSGGLYFTSDLTPNLPYAVDRRGVAKSDYDVGNITSFTDIGNDPGELSLVWDIHANENGVWISDLYKDPDDNVSGNSDDARIQKFNFSGTLQWTIRKLATVSDSWLFQHIVGFSDGSIIARLSAGANKGIYSYDSSGGNETLLLSEGGARGLVVNSINEFITPIADNKLAVYNQAGTLQRELEIDPPPGLHGIIGADMHGPKRLLVGGWDPEGNLGVSDFYIEDGTDTIISSVELRDNPGGGVSTQYLCVSEDMRIWARDGMSISYKDLTGITFTDWYRYPNVNSETGKVLLGSDYGLSIPEDDAFEGYHVSYFEIRDMRDAIEAMIGDYKLNLGANPYNLIGPSPDNIFKLAIDSGQSDWTTPTLAYLKVIPADAYEDIYLILNLLDDSYLV